MKWEGVMPAVTTKFTNDDQLDFKMFDVNIQAQIDAGVSGIFGPGSVIAESAIEILEKLIRT